MKKSNFFALLFGIASLLLFALGLCMTLLAEWNLFTEGIILGRCGLILGFITLIAWRKAEHKAPIKWNLRKIALTLYIVLSALIFGFGMCLCMVWESIVLGAIIGVFGILLLLMLIPLTKGLK